MSSYIRIATDSDLESVAAIEAAADTAFDAVFGSTDWGAPPTGASRLQHPGFILIAAESEGGPPQVEGGAPHLAHGMWAELDVTAD